MIQETQIIDHQAEQEQAAKLANELNIEELGLKFDEDLRLLIDKETGEIVRLFDVTDEQTAKAAMYRLFATRCVSEAVAKQQRTLTSRQRSIKRRLEWLKKLWAEGITNYAKGALGKTKSIDLTYGKVGYTTLGKGAVKVAEDHEDLAADFLMRNGDGTGLKIEFDLDQVSPEYRRSLMEMVSEILTIEDHVRLIEDSSALKPTLKKSTLTEYHANLATEHGKDLIRFIPAGTDAWYVREGKGGEEE